MTLVRSGWERRGDPPKLKRRNRREGNNRIACLGRARCGRGCAAPTVAASCRCRAYAHFADRDPLTKAVLERMLAGVPPACSKPNASSAAIIGYRDLARLAVAIERDLDRPTIPTPTKEAVRLIRD